MGACRRPAELILPGSPLDKEAARRGSSVYMPDKRIHMLPTGISENFLSLSEGNERLALTFKLDFSAAGNLDHLQISESLIKIERAIDYDAADQLLASDPWLTEAVKFAEMLKKQREANGAMMFPRQPELSVKVVDGEIVIERRNRDDLTQGMIAEFMIWPTMPLPSGAANTRFRVSTAFKRVNRLCRQSKNLTRSLSFLF